MRQIPLVNPPASTNAGSDTILTLVSEARQGIIQNNTAAVVNLNFDAPASPGTISIAIGATYAFNDVSCLTIHLYTAGAQTINGNSAGNIVVECWYDAF